MKLLYLSQSAETVHDRRFLAAFRSRDWDVVAVALYALAPEDLEGAVARFGAILAAEAPDVVYAGPVPTCGWVAARAGAGPLAVMSWGSDLLREALADPAAHARAAEALSAAALVQCDAEAVECELATRYGVSGDRVVRFPWGVDARRFSPALTAPDLRRRLGWQDLTVVVSNRSWEPVYDVPTALRAFSAAAAREPRLRLLLAGSGGLEPLIREMVASDSVLSDAVHVLGHVEPAEMPDVLRSADVYLSCSLSDGTSVSLLEAMATGLPAVVSDLASNREWIAGGVGGLLAPAGDAPAFADALVGLAADPASARAAGAVNRQTVCARADWDANVALLLDRLEALALR